MLRRPRTEEELARSHQAVDPFGIYGTRTEQRLLRAKRLRAMQQTVIFLAVLGLMGAALLYLRRPHAPVWHGMRVALTPPPGAAPVIAEDARGIALLVPTEGGDLQKFNPATGATSSVLDTAFPMRATPVVFRNAVFAPCEDGALYAVDWHTGRALWNHATGTPLSARPALAEISVPAPPPLLGSVKRHLVVIGNDGGLIRALEAGSGRMRWERGAGSPVGGGIVAVPGRGTEPPRVLVPLLEGTAGRGGLWCLDARNGKLLWKFPRDAKTSSPQLVAPAVDEAQGRVFCVDDTGAITCLRLRDGSKIWKRYAQPKAENTQEVVLLRGEPHFERDGLGERLIVGGNDGLVRCYNASDGQLTWSFDTGYPVRCRPLAMRSNGRSAVLIACDGPQLWLFDTATGSLLHQLRTREAAPFAPVSWNNLLFVATSQGSLEKFRFH